MECSEIWFSKHAFLRSRRRRIPTDGILEVVRTGEVIEHYPDDDPWPESVVLGETSTGPIHVVVGQEPRTGRCVIITVYTPDHEHWYDEFRRRRT